MPNNIYAAMGVNVEQADRGIQKIAEQIKSGWIKPPQQGGVLMDIGYFANVVSLDGKIGIASTIDGVGSKMLVAETMNKFDTIGYDCVAANVNDLICVGAKPLAMVDYIGLDRVDPEILEQIAIGLTAGARYAGISIIGGEISQLPQTMRGHDLVGSAFGVVEIDRMITGETVAPGDVIIGIESNGIHTNGLTMARQVFEQCDLNEPRPELNDGCIGAELLYPTVIYAREILELIEQVPVKALVNITGDGLLNLNRVMADGVGFLLNTLPEPMEIFDFIQQHGQLDDATMYQTFNNGVGFCVIVAPEDVEDSLNIINRHNDAQIIGSVIADADKQIYIPEKRLVGRGKQFFKE